MLKRCWHEHSADLFQNEGERGEAAYLDGDLGIERVNTYIVEYIRRSQILFYWIFPWRTALALITDPPSVQHSKSIRSATFELMSRSIDIFTVCYNIRSFTEGFGRKHIFVEMLISPRLITFFELPND